MIIYITEYALQEGSNLWFMTISEAVCEAEKIRNKKISDLTEAFKKLQQDQTVAFEEQKRKLKNECAILHIKEAIVVNPIITQDIINYQNIPDDYKRAG